MEILNNQIVNYRHSRRNAQLQKAEILLKDAAIQREMHDSLLRCSPGGFYISAAAGAAVAAKGSTIGILPEDHYINSSDGYYDRTSNAPYHESGLYGSAQYGCLKGFAATLSSSTTTTASISNEVCPHHCDSSATASTHQPELRFESPSRSKSATSPSVMVVTSTIIPMQHQNNAANNITKSVGDRINEPMTEIGHTEVPCKMRSNIDYVSFKDRDSAACSTLQQPDVIKKKNCSTFLPKCSASVTNKRAPREASVKGNRTGFNGGVCSDQVKLGMRCDAEPQNTAHQYYIDQTSTSIYDD